VKLVIDTNLLISGALWTGVPSQLIAATRDGRVRLFLSEPLLLELLETLLRPNSASRLANIGETAESLTARFREASYPSIPSKIPLPWNLRDPFDAHVLECAAGAETDAVVTGDRDLLVLGHFQGIPIITAAEALMALEKR
jgi:putative PIN family toxin of toxin-antitoxin system